jgi:hypothetical protein
VLEPAVRLPAPRLHGATHAKLQFPFSTISHIDAVGFGYQILF